MRIIMDFPCQRQVKSTSGYARRNDWTLEDVGSNNSKVFNIPIIVDKIFIIIGIGWRGRKGGMTKLIVMEL